MGNFYYLTTFCKDTFIYIFFKQFESKQTSFHVKPKFYQYHFLIGQLVQRFLGVHSVKVFKNNWVSSSETMDLTNTDFYEINKEVLHW